MANEQSAFFPNGPTVVVTANATAPTAVQILPTFTAVTTTGNAVPIVAGAVEVFNFPPTSFFTATAASSTTLYITPGQGL